MVDDPSGNSFVESPTPYQVDPAKILVHYHRTFEQNKLLGLLADHCEEEENDEESPAVWESKDEMKNEVYP